MRLLNIATKSNAARVFALAFLLSLGFELAFMHGVVFSEFLILDDIFYYERALSGRSFNDIGEFLPALNAFDHDGMTSLNLYKKLFVWIGDVPTMRLLHIFVLAVGCGLFGLSLYFVTQDIIVAVLGAFASFVTPFTPIQGMFLTGSYNLFFFALFFLSLLALRKVDLNPPRASSLTLFVLIVCLLLVAVYFFRGGTILVLLLLAFFFAHRRVYETPSGRRIIAATAAVVAPLLYLAIATFEHPYKHFPGRITSAPGDMMLNGLGILSNMLTSYAQPMLKTGALTQQGGYVPAVIYILTALVGVGLAWRRRKRLVIERERMFQLAFLLLALLVSFGPYILLTRTHIWHYMPHMIFFISLNLLMIFFLFGRRATLLFLFIVCGLTTYSYARQSPAYENALARERPLVKFIASHASEWSDYDRIVVLTNEDYGMTGLSGSFRSTALLRLTAGRPDGPWLLILRDNQNARNTVDDLAKNFRVVAYRVSQDQEFLLLSDRF